MNDVLVSIIIPTYNRAHVIGETLDSILDQIYTNWECIIVDDGSTDNSSELINTYVSKDKRFQYVKRPSNKLKGANSCRNHGYTLSTGKYIQWFDSDDLMHTELLQKKVLLLEESPDINFCLCAMQSFKMVNGEMQLSKKTLILHTNLFETYVAGKISIGTPTVLWRKRVLEQEENLFDETLTQSQDLELNSRIFFKHNEGLVIDEPLIQFRKWDGTISQNFLSHTNKHLDSFLKVRKRILNYDSSNLTVNTAIVKSSLALMRSALAERDYKTCNRLLKFIKSNNKNKKPIFLLKLFRIDMAYNIFKFLGRGDTKFKNLLKI